MSGKELKLAGEGDSPTQDNLLQENADGIRHGKPEATEYRVRIFAQHFANTNPRDGCFSGRRFVLADTGIESPLA